MHANRRFVTSLAVGLAALAAHRLPAQSDSALHLVVSLSARTLYEVVGQDTVISYPVAIGQPSHPTPTGAFHIRTIVWNPEWIPPKTDWAKRKTYQAPGSPANPMKLVKIFFREPDYYIHGTDDPASIGYAASHGCLRMRADDAYQVARDVMDHGGEPRDESWFWRVIHFSSDTKTVYLDHPISISIVQ